MINALCIFQQKSLTNRCRGDDTQVFSYAKHYSFMLQDRFGRIHDYLRLSLTDSCNYRCVYCLPEPQDPLDLNALNTHSSGSSVELPALTVLQSHLPAVTSSGKRMSADEICQLAEIFVHAGVKKIRLTGGEPLLRHDVAQIIHRLSLLPVELCLSTNGSLIHRHFQTIVNAGIRTVNVSLDSLKADVFRRLSGIDDFEQVRANIELLYSTGMQVKVNMVVLRGHNDDEILDFVRWTLNSAIHVRFIEFMPFPSNQWQPEKLLRSDEMLAQITQQFPEIEKMNDAAHDTSRKYRVKNAAGTFAFISTMSQPFCSDCNRLRLSADGKMRNCLFASTEMDLAQALRAGEDVGARIRECLGQKAEMLGGHLAEHWEVERTHAAERSMMSIGG